MAKRNAVAWRLLVTHSVELGLRLSVAAGGRLVVYGSSASVRYVDQGTAVAAADELQRSAEFVRRGLRVVAVPYVVKVEAVGHSRPGCDPVKQPSSGGARQQTWFSGLL